MIAPVRYPHPAEMLFRQAALSRDTTVQSRIDRAEWLRAAGHDGPARLLFGMAALRFGLSDAHRRLLAPYAGRFGCALRDAAAAPPPAEPAFAVDLAVAELARVLPIAAHGHGAARAAVEGRDDSTDAALDALVARVDPVLSAVLAGEGEPAALETLAEAAAAFAPVDLSRHADAPVERLASLVLLRELQAFRLLEGGLVRAPLGSPALLDAAARFEPTALGGWFANVERLLRGPDDLFALIRLAARAAAVGEADVAGWCMVLSTRFSSQALRDLSTALLRRGMLGAVRALVARVEERAGEELDRELLWHLRDTAMRMDRADVAIDCQAMLARHAGTNTLEWVILADLCAISEDLGGARDALAAALAIAPSGTGLAARLAALDAGTADRYARTKGFFSAPERLRIRLTPRGEAG